MGLEPVLSYKDGTNRSRYQPANHDLVDLSISGPSATRTDYKHRLCVAATPCMFMLACKTQSQKSGACSCCSNSSETELASHHLPLPPAPHLPSCRCIIHHHSPRHHQEICRWLHTNSHFTQGLVNHPSMKTLTKCTLQLVGRCIGQFYPWSEREREKGKMVALLPNKSRTVRSNQTSFRIWSLN